MPKAGSPARKTGGGGGGGGGGMNNSGVKRSSATPDEHGKFKASNMMKQLTQVRRDSGLPPVGQHGMTAHDATVLIGAPMIGQSPIDPSQQSHGLLGGFSAMGAGAMGAFEQSLMGPSAIAQNSEAYMMMQKLTRMAEDAEMSYMFQFLSSIGLKGLVMQIKAVQLQRKFFPETVEQPFPGLAVVVRSMWFQVMIAGLILANAVTIGMDTYYEEADFRNGVRPAYMDLADHLFVLAFLLEWIARMIVEGFISLLDLANFADTLLVWVTGVLLVWVFRPLGLRTRELRLFAAMRVLRIARAIRQIRVVPEFKELWVLVKGITESYFLMAGVLFIFALLHMVFGVFLYGNLRTHEYQFTNEFFNDNFGSLAQCMVYGFQLTTASGWAEAAKLAVEAGGFWVVIAITAFLGISTLVLFNLCTSVVVEFTFDAMHNDEEMLLKHKKVFEQRAMKKLVMMFREIDEDGTGTLTKQEFLDVMDDTMFLIRLQSLDLEIADLPDCWNICDDGDGCVEQMEFIDGMMKISSKTIQTRYVFKCNQLVTMTKRTVNRSVYFLGQNLGFRFAWMFSTIEQFKKKHEEITYMILDLKAALQARQVESMMDITMNGILTVPNTPIKPTPDFILNGPKNKAEAMKYQTFKMRAKKEMAAKRESVVKFLSDAPVSKELQLYALQREPFHHSDSDYASSEAEEAPPPPPPSELNSRSRGTQTDPRFTRPRGGLTASVHRLLRRKDEAKEAQQTANGRRNGRAKSHANGHANGHKHYEDDALPRSQLPRHDRPARLERHGWRCSRSVQCWGAATAQPPSQIRPNRAPEAWTNAEWNGTLFPVSPRELIPLPPNGHLPESVPSPPGSPGIARKRTKESSGRTKSKSPGRRR